MVDLPGYDAWKCDDSPHQHRSRCEGCHRMAYGCVDADYEGECWHVCERCLDRIEREQDFYVDPDALREDRNDRDN
jgi:hypothetical protein